MANKCQLQKPSKMFFFHSQTDLLAKQHFHRPVPKLIFKIKTSRPFALIDFETDIKQCPAKKDQTTIGIYISN